MKKIFSLCVLLVAGALASCGETSSVVSNNSTGTSTPSSSVAPSSSGEDYMKKHYELAGTNDELYEMFGAFEGYAVLENGTGKIYDGTVTNSTNVLTYTEIDVTYKIVTDEDGITELTVLADGTKIKSTMAADNSFELTFSHAIGGSGFSRPVVLKGTASTLYADATAWKTAIDAKYADRTVTVTESAVYTGIVTEVGQTTQFKTTMGGYEVPFSAKIVLFSDFTVEANYGVAGESFRSLGRETGTWTTGSDKSKKITIKETEYTVTDTDTTETFTWLFTYGTGDAAKNLQSVVTYTKTA